MKIIKISFVLVLVSLIAACGKSDEKPQQSGGGWASYAGGGFSRPATSVEVIPAERGFIAEQVRSYGTVQSQELIAITPQFSNRVTEIYVDLGDEVKKGQALAKIYDTTLKDQYNQAKAQLSQSRVALERDSTQYVRQQQLLDRELISQSEFDIAYATYRNSAAQYETSVANLTQAEENLGNTIIRSPANGVIVTRTIEIGNLATTGAAAFELASDTGFETRLFLPVQDWRVVKVGQEVSLRASNEESANATGIISRKSPQLDPTTGLGEVVVTINTTGNSIFAGVLTESSINIVTKERAIIVPRSALVEKVETVVEPESNTIQLERTYSVFVAEGDTVAVQRPLTLGIEQGDKIEVLAGLNEGDKVIITGQQGLRNGAKVRIASGDNFTTPEELKIATQEAGGNRGGWGASGGGERPGGQRPAATKGDTSKATASSQPPRGGARGEFFAQLSEEDRAKLRAKMQTLSPEERRTYMASLRDSLSKADSSN